ncbi:uncharacterized protein LOC143823012 [Paroedura picta]|uniref:uncharacterized protein LOC143823012 n=1 Tax=Paroedura picta TaxID=143630 RepID=UPI004056FAD7
MGEWWPEVGSRAVGGLAVVEVTEGVPEGGAELAPESGKGELGLILASTSESVSLLQAAPASDEAHDIPRRKVTLRAPEQTRWTSLIVIIIIFRHKKGSIKVVQVIRYEKHQTDCTCPKTDCIM